MSNQIFKNFSEFWYYTKALSDSQRQIILRTLPRDEQKKLKESYEKGGWDSLFMRNKADRILDEIKKEFGWDLIELRMKILSNQKVKIRKRFWNYINDKFKGECSAEHIEYIFGNYRAVECEDNNDWYNLIPSRRENE